MQPEGVDVTGVITPEGAATSVAGVVVDRSGEPAYLGYPGTLRLNALPKLWGKRIAKAEALFADGWADHAGVPNLILGGLRAARAAGVPSFFHSRPGHPAGEHARPIRGKPDPLDSARALLRLGPKLVVIKRGVAGCFLVRKGEVHLAGGYPVEARDATGAGDSLDAAIIYAWLRKMPLAAMGVLANAVGAAKVLKLGTGRNVPTRGEVRAILRRFGVPEAGLLEES